MSDWFISVVNNNFISIKIKQKTGNIIRVEYLQRMLLFRFKIYKIKNEKIIALYFITYISFFTFVNWYERKVKHYGRRGGGEKQSNYKNFRKGGKLKTSLEIFYVFFYISKY